MKVKKTGLMLAGVAATLLASGFVAVNANEGHHHKHGVKCMGANSCKGKSDCKGKDNSCKGKNDCKGKGWSHMKDAAECEKAGGTVEAKH